MSDSVCFRQDVRHVVALACAPAIGLGIARFAYALLLPDMKADLALSYAEAGWLNTTNAVGYLAGALGAAVLIRALGAAATVRYGVLSCILALGLSALSRDLVVLNAMRAIEGIGAGISFVAGGVLTTGIAGRHAERSSFVLGIFYAGPGVGIALSGATVPFVQELLGPGSWQPAWGLLAAMSLLLGIGPILLRGEAAQASTGAAGSGIALRMKWLLAGYFIFGAGYIGYMTFMIAWVIGRGGGVSVQAAFWSVLGLGAVATPWLWSGLLRRQRHGWAFAILCTITAAGAALPLLSGSLLFQLASAALFGCSFFAVVASTTAFARRNFTQRDWATAIGALTVSFGIGQMIGPLLVGWMNDASGGLNAGLSASAGLLLLASFVAAWQGDEKTRGSI